MPQHVIPMKRWASGCSQLLDTSRSSRFTGIGRGRSAHVFNNQATMERVAQAIIERGEFRGVIRGYERYGLFFAEPIGYRISPDDGLSTPLFCGEVKIDAEDRYHVIPRTRPS